MNIRACETQKSRWFTNARVPVALAEGFPLRALDHDSGLATMDFGITADGALTPENNGGAELDLAGRMVLPTFIDSHVHLDKAYIVRRTGIPHGGLLDAVKLSGADAANWSQTDLKNRISQALERAYLHGTSAIRTHLDTPVMPDESDAWRVFDEMRSDWQGRIALQAVALMALERVEQAEFIERCRQISRLGGVLGAFIAPKTATPERLDALFSCAGETGLAVDFHVDETLAPDAMALELICDSILRTGFKSPVMAGHCCSLSSMPTADRDRIIEKVARAGVHIVSLPHSNLFLQDRSNGATPSRRGMTTVRELAAGGTSVHFASDNVQDPFYPYGDFDMVDVFRSAVRTAHLETDIGSWAARQFREAAKACGFSQHGLVAAGAPADLIILDAGDWLDLMSRSSAGRVVLRGGAPLQPLPFNLRDLFAMEYS